MGLEHDEMVRLYGPWAGRTPEDAAGLFHGYHGLWWMAGGWSLEAFTGVSRRHDDCDPCVLRAELPLLRRHLAGRLDIWTATNGSLRPLLPDEGPAAAASEVLPEDAVQVWTRRSGSDPWEFDILLAPGDRGTWVYRRDPRLAMPMSDALWERDGIRYLQPQIQLLYKARGLRPKDWVDFESTLPFLDDRQRTWLVEALRATLPEHPWLTRLTVGNG